MEYRLFRELSGDLPFEFRSPLTNEERLHVRSFENGEIRVRTIQGNTMTLSHFKPVPQENPA